MLRCEILDGVSQMVIVSVIDGCNKVLTIDAHPRSLTVVHLGSSRGTRDVDGRVEVGIADVEFPRVDADYRTWRSIAFGYQHSNLLFQAG